MCAISINQNGNLPMTVMLNWPEASFIEVSYALQVTVVKPTGYLPPDVTMLPAWSSHTMVGLTEPSQASKAVGVDDQVTTASGLPGSTNCPGTSLGRVRTGA